MLSIEQITTLRTVVDRVIPPDDWPGGWEAGVGDYLFRQFEPDLKEALPMYAQGLDALDAEAQAVHGASFATLDAAQQDALLAKVEQGDVQTAWPVDPASFFAMLVDHCTEGFYSDPGNGGNRNEVGWRMIGFEVRG